MVYFGLAIFGLVCYMIFMMVKASQRIKNTKLNTSLHLSTAFMAIILFLLLLTKQFEFRFPWSFLGLIFIFVGGLTIIAAFLAIRSQAFSQKGDLITKGIYAYIRNPIYLGLILITVGSIFFSFSVYITAYTFLLIILFLLVIKAEEKELFRRFGKKYTKYKKKVPSLVPKFRDY